MPHEAIKVPERDELSPEVDEKCSKSRWKCLAGLTLVAIIIVVGLVAQDASSTTESLVDFRLKGNVISTSKHKHNLGYNNPRDLEDAAEDEKEEEEEEEKDEEEEDDEVIVIDDYIDDFYAFQEYVNPYALLPLSAVDVIGFLLTGMGLTLAAGGGIGGGGIVVPIYILIFQIPPTYAVPLGSVALLGASLAATAFNMRKRHPLVDRPLIDWNLILVMEPLILVGALFGAIFHRMLSDKILVVLLVLLMCFIARSSLKKAKFMYDAENSYIERLQKHNAKSKEADKYVPPQEEGEEETDLSLDTDMRQQILILNPDFVSLRSTLLEKERVTPKSKIIALCCLFTVVILLNIMVGGGAFPSPWGIVCGGLSFWVVHVIMSAVLISFAWAAQTYLVHMHAMKQLIQFTHARGDVIWDDRGAVVFPLVFLSAGIFAGCFGIGGGIVVVPMLLHLGVHPAVAAATSSCMIVFTSFASLTSFAIFGLVFWDYAVALFVIGVLTSLFGQKLMRRARKNAGEARVDDQNFERLSFIAFSIGGVVLLSAFLMTIQYVFTIVQMDNSDDGRGLCEGYGAL